VIALNFSASQFCVRIYVSSASLSICDENDGNSLACSLDLQRKQTTCQTITAHATNSAGISDAKGGRKHKIVTIFTFKFCHICRENWFFGVQEYALKSRLESVLRSSFSPGHLGLHHNHPLDGLGLRLRRLGRRRE
jgi:hypothetical protein